jgi:hypothetical protein
MRARVPVAANADEALARHDIAFVDPIEGFKKEGFKATHFAHDGHWSALGHKLAGEALAAWFAGRGLAKN